MAGGMDGGKRPGTSPVGQWLSGSVGEWICQMGGPGASSVGFLGRVEGVVRGVDFRAVLSRPGAHGWGPSEIRAEGNGEQGSFSIALAPG